MATAVETFTYDVPKWQDKHQADGRTKAVKGLDSSTKTAVDSCTNVVPEWQEKPKAAIRTNADKGLVSPPKLRPATKTLDHVINAFLEFKAVTIGTKVMNHINCNAILQAYRRGNDELLKAKLDEADACIYDNATSQVLKGKMSEKYMAAYNATSGFVCVDEILSEQYKRLVFKTLSYDPIVVIAKCTKVMLDDQILDMADTLVEIPGMRAFDHWNVPKIIWINGVPGCGKTTWIVNHFKMNDIIITTTTEAANDTRKMLALRIGAGAKRRVRTMASVLVNGLRSWEMCYRLLVDEALMNHFGAIVMAIRITNAREALLIGDHNQLPYIDRNNLFPLVYNRPNLITNISHELLCTHRNPMDVAYALSEIYKGIYASKIRIRSLTLKKYTGAQISPNLTNTLYLVHTQAGKEHLISQGFGKGTGSRTLTIHEAQGLTSKNVVIVRTSKAKTQLYSSVPHAVVAISRHTGSCVYYTDCREKDATAQLITRAKTATTTKIWYYNLKMAIRNGDISIVLFSIFVTALLAWFGVL